MSGIYNLSFWGLGVRSWYAMLVMLWDEFLLNGWAQGLG
jgi:hypothetical protein